MLKCSRSSAQVNAVRAILRTQEEEPMTTRREILLVAAVMAFSAGFAGALPDKSAPLEVTYYYLPG